MSDVVLQVSKYNIDFWVEGVWYPAAIDMNFELQAGKVLAIVGESGSGKSTTAMGLMDLLASNARVSGSVKVKGQEMIGAKKSLIRKARGREVAYIFQEPMTALNPVYTIGFQIVETLRTHFDMGPQEAKVRAIELITMVEIPNPEASFDKYPHQLSGGQRQRAMIAQSLACDPGLLVADEPTTALDVTVQAEILDLMRSLQSRLNSAILLITHDMGVVADLADDILVMKDGVTVEYGTSDQIFHRPQHPYTQQLLAAVPKLGSAAIRKLSPELAGLPPVLKLENVSIEYPKKGRVPAFRAVSDFSLEIFPGEIVGLVGESGSGKTTVGRAAIGLLPIVEGRIEIVGKDISKPTPAELREIRKHTGIVFQDPASSLNPRLPIGESIGEPIDEPTSALDVSVQARFLELLQNLQNKLKFACLFITHDLAVVDILSHRIAVMQNGRIVEVGLRDEILKSPRQEYTRRLISAVPVPDPVEQRARREARLSMN